MMRPTFSPLQAIVIIICMEFVHRVLPIPDRPKSKAKSKRKGLIAMGKRQGGRSDQDEKDDEVDENEEKRIK
jgi:hypothetical protein